MTDTTTPVDTTVVDTTTTDTAAPAADTTVATPVVETAVATPVVEEEPTEENAAPGYVAPVAAPVVETPAAVESEAVVTPATEPAPVAAEPVIETPEVVAAPVAAAAPVEAPAEPVEAAPVIEAVPAAPIVEEAPAAPAVEIITPVVDAPVAPVTTSGTLAPSTTADVGASIPVAAAVVSDVYANTVFAGLNADTYSAELQSAFAKILATGSSIAKNTVADVLGYAKRMGPSYPHDSHSGSTEQIALYTSLINAVNNGDTDFSLTWAVVLRIVSETKAAGAFNDRLCFRFFPYMALDQGARTTFRNMLSIMTTTADASGRATAMKQIDFQKALGNQYSEAGKNRLLTFYTV